MSRRRKLRLAKAQMQQNGIALPGCAKQSDLQDAKWEARAEEKLPTREREILNHDALHENKKAAQDARKHRQLRKESFEWAPAGIDKKARQDNILNTGVGKHQDKISFTLKPGDMARVQRQLGHDGWPGYVPKDGVGVIVSEEEYGQIAFLFAGMTMKVPLAALRPLDWSDDED